MSHMVRAVRVVQTPIVGLTRSRHDGPYRACYTLSKKRMKGETEGETVSGTVSARFLAPFLTPFRSHSRTLTLCGSTMINLLA